MSAAWWRRAPVLRRFVVDLLADEMARHRRAAVQHASLWSDHLRLDDDLGCDSLELVTLATALAEAVHLHESGIEDYLLARRTLGDWIAIVPQDSGRGNLVRAIMGLQLAFKQGTRHWRTPGIGRADD